MLPYVSGFRRAALDFSAKWRLVTEMSVTPLGPWRPIPRGRCLPEYRPGYSLESYSLDIRSNGVLFLKINRKDPMRIATFNINSINGRLANLLRWLEVSSPDVACLQEIKCTNAAFPRKALEAAGYRAIWCGQGPHHGVAILARDVDPIETRRNLPGDSADREARYIEAAVNGLLIGCLNLPNGNPQPGPKFAYKLDWFGRLIAYAEELKLSRAPVVLAGDYNVVPTDADIYAMRSWRTNALVQPEPRAAFARLVSSGWTDALRELHPDETMYTFWDYKRDAWSRARRRHASRPSSSQRNHRAEARCRGRRSQRPRPVERERPCTSVGRDPRLNPKPAPVSCGVGHGSCACRNQDGKKGLHA